MWISGVERKLTTPSVEYYYDYHLTREDKLTGYSYPDHNLYSMLDTLNWLFQKEGWFVGHRMNFYRTFDPTEMPLSPELAVFKNVNLSEEEKLDAISWSVADGLPAPTVVFEFMAKPLWQKQHTMALKPGLYQKLGVKEIFAFNGIDLTGLARNAPVKRSLWGWRCENGELIKIEPNQRGWLWSTELNSWVACEHNALYLYDREGNLRLTEFQVAEAARGNYWLHNNYDLETDEVDKFYEKIDPTSFKEIIEWDVLAAKPEEESPEEDEEEDDEEDNDLDHGGDWWRYFDLHFSREDSQGKIPAQQMCTRHLENVLDSIYDGTHTLVASRLGIYRTKFVKEYPTEPDIAVFKNTVGTARDFLAISLQSWKIARVDRPAPSVAIEVTNCWLWQMDLYQKPLVYKKFGVHEYFVYDPYPDMSWDKPRRLYGWRYEDGEMFEIEPDANERLWSVELNSWLVPDEVYLRLFDADNKERLPDVFVMGGRYTSMSDEEREARRAFLERQRESLENRHELERLHRKLRELGIDPESL